MSVPAFSRKIGNGFSSKPSRAHHAGHARRRPAERDQERRQDHRTDPGTDPAGSPRSGATAAGWAGCGWLAASADVIRNNTPLCVRAELLYYVLYVLYYIMYYIILCIVGPWHS